MPESFAEKLARLKAEAEASAPPSLAPSRVSSLETSSNEHDADLVPDVGTSYTPTTEDEEVDKIVGGLDILTAYRRFCGKMEPNPGSKRESIMISCPKPDHRDSNPSAWVNLDLNTWFCGTCEEGGDVIDMIARTKGYGRDDYKSGKTFPELKREIAADLGYVIRTTPGGDAYTVPVEPEVESEPEEPSSLTDPPPSLHVHSTDPPESGPPVLTVVPELAPVTKLHDDGQDTPIIPKIEWMSIVPPDTFLYEWMNVMRHDDLPDEFYFWHGLTALGFAAGRETMLADRLPVTANLFVCLYGPSGQGKSRSTSQLTRLLREALPYKKADPDDMGAYLVPTPGSPEALIDSFSRPVPDDSDPKIIDHYGKVRGLIRFDELSTLIGRASRTGNPLKPALQQFYDADPLIMTSSRGHGDVEAHEAFCSVVTTTQPKAIRQVLVATDVDSGFANRWVYVMGHSKPPIPFGGPALDITNAADRLKKLHGWCAYKWMITLSDDALDIWTDFYRTELAKHHSSEDAMTSRVPLLMKKIILLLAINSQEHIVSADTVNSAIMLYPYLMATYSYLSGDLGSGERNDLDQAIIKAAKAYNDRTGKWPSARDIYANLGKQHRDSSEYNRSLKTLTEIGILDEQVTKPKTGRPTTRYAVKEYWTG